MKETLNKFVHGLFHKNGEPSRTSVIMNISFAIFCIMGLCNFFFGFKLNELSFMTFGSVSVSVKALSSIGDKLSK